MKTRFNLNGSAAKPLSSAAAMLPAFGFLVGAAILMTSLLLVPTKAHAETVKAQVLQVQCGHYLVKTSSDYAVVRWYGGAKVGVNDVLVGKLNDFGMHTLKSVTADADTTAHIENYGLSKEAATKVLGDQCV